MTQKRGSILNNLLQQHQKGLPMTSKYLLRQGVSYDLQRRYVASGWLERIGHGLYKRVGDEVSWEGMMSLLQKEGFTTHLGARSALIVFGGSHYHYFGNYPLFLGWAYRVEEIPEWFSNNIGKKIFQIPELFSRQLLGIVTKEIGQLNFNASTKERAILEMLFFARNVELLVEVLEVIEICHQPNISLFQKLLESCKNFRVKRLFHFAVDKVNPAWKDDLDFSKVDFGRGKISFDGGGVFLQEYNLTVPHRLINRHEYMEYEF